MGTQDNQNLWEAYLSVYQNLDEADHSERISQIRNKKPRMRDKHGYPIAIGHGVVKTPQQHSRQSNLDTHSLEKKVFSRKQGERHDDRIEKLFGSGNKSKRRRGIDVPDTRNEQIDLYDIILLHLLEEGYAETIESAEIIANNISEEWICEILSEKFVKSMNPQKGRKSLSDRQTYKGSETSPFRGNASRSLRHEIARSSGRSKKPEQNN